MNALLSVDESLFRFINQKLANPVFDVVMPFLSGNPFFFPAVIAIAVFMLWRGGCRGRIYLLMITILLSLGDPLLCNSLKNHFERPRPFVTQEGTRRPNKNPMVQPNTPAAEPSVSGVQVQTKRSYSMPSAHAFNWGAITAITLIYYRRSWRFMVPLALAISFSRIYEGVHYPSDVLAGLLLGAVYGFFGVLALNALWKSAGKRLFPSWQKRLPDVALPKMEETAVLDLSTSNLQWLRLGWLLIIGVFIGRLFYLASGTIQLSEDEAYQWLWSKHLALSYYSKPFGIAVAQWIGTSICGDTELGVRFLSPVLGAVLGIVLLHFVGRHTNGRTAFMFTLISLATPLVAVGSVLITVDPLVVFFWTLAMLAGWRAIGRDSTAWWLVCGLGMSGAFLSKFISPLQWASFALFFLFCPSARSQLRRPGPWLAIGLNLLATLPVILWNQQHNWITMTHLKERSSLEKTWQPTLKYFFEFVGAELGLLNIVFAIAILWAIVAFLRTDFKQRATAAPRVTLELFLLCQGIIVLGLFTLYSFHSRIQPNWIAACVVPLLLFATLWWDRRWQAGDRKPVRFLVLGLGLGLPLVVFAHNTNLIGKVFGTPLPPKLDFLRRVRGGNEIARIVGKQRNTLLQEGKPVFIVADHYGRAGLMNFYMPEARPLVAGESLVTMNRAEHPKNQLWFWPGYDAALRKGQNALYVCDADRPKPQPEWLDKEFGSVTNLGIFDINYRGRVYDRIQIYACRDRK